MLQSFPHAEEDQQTSMSKRNITEIQPKVKPEPIYYYRVVKGGGSKGRGFPNIPQCQWLLLVPIKGGIGSI